MIERRACGLGSHCLPFRLTVGEVRQADRHLTYTEREIGNGKLLLFIWKDYKKEIV